MRLLKKSLTVCCFVWLTVSAMTVMADSPRLLVDSGGHTSLIGDVMFTHDGKYLISAGHDKAIRVWDLESGKTIRTIRGWIGDGHEGKIYAAALSRDDRYLAIGGWMGTPIERDHGPTSYEEVNAIRIFDFQTGELIRTLEGSDSVVTELAFTPSGDYLISGDARGHICVWTMAPGHMKRLLRFNKHEKGIKNIRVSPNGRLAASLSVDGSLKLWEVETALVIKNIGRQRSFAFSPDGLHIASGTDDNRLLIWGAKDGEFKRELARFDSEITSLSYNPDGTKVIALMGSACKVLQADSGKVSAALKGNGDEIVSAAASPVGTTVATVGKNGSAIFLWSYEDGEIFKRLSGSGTPVFAVGFAKDGQAVAFGTKSDYKELNNRGPLESVFRFAQGDSYDVRFERKIRNEKEFVGATDTSNGYVLKPKESSPSNTLQIVRNGQVSSQIKLDASYTCYTFTPDGQYIVVGTYDGNIEVYKTESPRLAFLRGRKDRDLVGHTDVVWSVAVSPNGRTLVSGSADQTLRLWDIESGKNILTMFAGGDGEWVAWTPEGYYASSLNGDKYIGWHVSKGIERSAEYYPAAQFQRQYYHPNIVADYLKSRDIKMALRRANEKLGKPPDPAAEVPPSGPAVNVTNIVPPIVLFTSPGEDGSVVNDESLIVKAVAAAAQHTPPVTEIKVFLNGTEVGARQGSHRELPIEVEVQLQSGTNMLSVIAQSAQATADPVVRKIIYTGKNRGRTKPNLRILSIGVSKYKEASLALKFADRDATEFASLLKGQENLHLLFNKVESKILLNEEVTRESVIDALGWLSNREEVKAGDLLLLFLSGHGGLSKGNYYFYTHDHDPKDNPEKNDIRWSTLMDDLTLVPDTKPILFVDTCRAGAAMGDGRPKGDQGLTQALRDLKNKYQGVVFFAASSSDELSLELDKLQHGAFTYALLEGLKGNADLPPTNRFIYIDELGLWVRQQVKKLTNNHQEAIYNEPPNLKPFPIFALPR